MRASPCLMSGADCVPHFSSTDSRDRLREGASALRLSSHPCNASRLAYTLHAGPFAALGKQTARKRLLLGVLAAVYGKHINFVVGVLVRLSYDEAPGAEQATHLRPCTTTTSSPTRSCYRGKTVSPPPPPPGERTLLPRFTSTRAADTLPQYHKSSQCHDDVPSRRFDSACGTHD
jgi:hypothetical protein